MSITVSMSTTATGVHYPTAAILRQGAWIKTIISEEMKCAMGMAT
jgi:hypothetical protein